MVYNIVNISLIISILCMLGYLSFAYKHLNIADKIHVDYSVHQLSDYEPLIVAKHFKGDGK